jgi:hypothetical protein
MDALRVIGPFTDGTFAVFSGNEAHPVLIAEFHQPDAERNARLFVLTRPVIGRIADYAEGWWADWPAEQRQRFRQRYPEHIVCRSVQCVEDVKTLLARPRTEAAPVAQEAAT